MTQQLFRTEAIEARNNRLAGTVVLALPIQLRVYIASLLSVALFIGGLVAFGSYTRRETVPGILVPEGGLGRIVPRAQGRIEQVYVSQGQRVEAGARLVTISEDVSLASGGPFSNISLESIDTEINEVKRRIEATVDKAAADRRGTQSRLKRQQDEYDSLARQTAFQEKRMQLAQTISEDITGLADRGLASLIVKRERQAQVVALQQGLEDITQRAARLRGDLAESEAQLQAHDAQEIVLLSELNGRIANLIQRRAEIESRGRYTLNAPAAGTVVLLSVRPGDHVRADATLLGIAAPGGPLVAELMIPSRAAGFLKPGQSVRLQYNAFPYLRFGAGEGTVKEISQAAISASPSITGRGIEEPVFQVRVALAEDAIHAYGQRHPLQPGMTLSAVIALDQQPLWRIVFDPLRAAMREGGVL